MFPSKHNTNASQYTAILAFFIPLFTDIVSWYREFPTQKNKFHHLLTSVLLHLKSVFIKKVHAMQFKIKIQKVIQECLMKLWKTLT